MTNWIILIVAGFFESCFAFCLGKMKGVVGLEYYFWGIGFLACLALSMILLAKAIQTIPIGTAYPVWTGIGNFRSTVFRYDINCINHRSENGLIRNK